MHHCPTCGRTYLKTKRDPVDIFVPSDTTTMTRKELYAYHKRTAPAADIAVVLDHLSHGVLWDQIAAVPVTRDGARRARDLWRAQDHPPGNVAAFWKVHHIMLQPMLARAKIERPADPNAWLLEQQATASNWPPWQRNNNS
mgnify:CR=1 FL=1